MSTEKKTDGKTAAGMKTGGTGGGGGITSHLRTGMEWNGMETQPPIYLFNRLMVTAK